MTQTARLDPIRIEILFNGLRSIADEMFIALRKSAYSTNIKERQDHSTVICDARGRQVIQAEASLPVHIASMIGLLQTVIDRFGATMQEGDIYFANDPHVAGGTHLPDVNMAMPVFVDGKVAAFVCNIAHHADMGGASPGSMSGGLTEIYQEGLRIPVTRLCEGYEIVRPVLDLVLLNVRVPRERRGDYYAQIAACRLGERRLKEFIAEHGLPPVTAVFGELIERTGARMRSHLHLIPDGEYAFEDFMDNDGLDVDDIPIRLKIAKAGERIAFDFTGSSPQVPGNINVTLNATCAAVCYSLKALLDPDVPNNQGLLEFPQIIAPRGSIVNAVFPASVAGRAHTCQRIIDVVIGALANALPERAVAAANGANTTAVFSGVDPRSGEPYVYLETLGGGFGGRATKDGKDGVQVHITNTSNLPVEAIETEYPLFVENYELIPGSGGAGRYRGGLGLRRTISPVGHDCVFSGMGERFVHRPWGLFGGGKGATGRFLLHGNDGAARALPVKPRGLPVRAGERLVVETPGAGGYGDPGQRDERALSDDIADGKVDAGPGKADGSAG